MAKTLEKSTDTIPASLLPAIRKLRELKAQRERAETEEKELKETVLKALPDGVFFADDKKVTLSAGSRETFELTDAEKEQIRRHGRNKVSSFRMVRV